MYLDNLERGDFDCNGPRPDMRVEYDFRLAQVNSEADSSRGFIKASQHLSKILQRCKDGDIVSETEMRDAPTIDIYAPSISFQSLAKNPS